MKKVDFSARPSPIVLRAGVEHGPAPAGRDRRRAVRRAALYDWTTDGGDNQRTGWNKQEKTLTKDNVKNLKLLWKLETRQPGPRAAFADAGARRRPAEHAGGREAGRVSSAGISDNLYAFDADTGKILWQKHWDYAAPAGRGGGGGGGGQQPQDPAHLGFLRPGGSSDTPVIGPPDAQGRRPLYFVTGDGMLHIAERRDRRGSAAAVHVPHRQGLGAEPGRQRAVDGEHLRRATVSRRCRLDDPQHKVMSFNAGSGGAWGRRGAVIDSTGTAWTTTGDGIYDPTSDPPRYANSVVGVQIVGDELKLKDYYTPTNWDWLRKRDLDPNNTPTIFTFKGRELMAASGKECRVYLLDPKSLGGADHQTPLFKTPLFCNEEVDFQDAGSWGALSTWEDAAGTRWVLAPFWGPAHSQAKFPIMNTPLTKDGGVAAFKVEDKDGKLELDAGVDLARHEARRAGHHRQRHGVRLRQRRGDQAGVARHRPAVRFDDPRREGHARDDLRRSTRRPARSCGRAATQMHQWNHFSGITVANGRVYLGTYDGTLYCFGLQ